MERGPLILVGGGARSGKSRFAGAYARRLGPERIYLATAQALDAEMAERIDRHRAERAQDFVTVEEPLALAAALAAAPSGHVALVDCLTLWLSNLLGAGLTDGEILARLEAVLSVAAERSGPTLLVTNEVGLGVVPESALGRRFRDLAGSIHQRVVSRADEVYVAVMGLVIRLYPAPLVALRAGDLPDAAVRPQGGGSTRSG